MEPKVHKPEYRYRGRITGTNRGRVSIGVDAGFGVQVGGCWRVFGIEEITADGEFFEASIQAWMAAARTLMPTERYCLSLISHKDPEAAIEGGRWFTEFEEERFAVEVFDAANQSLADHIRQFGLGR